MPPTDATRLRPATLPTRAPTEFDLVPDAEALARLRDDLGLTALRKVRLTGQIAPSGAAARSGAASRADDWHLTAHLGATVVQPCAITLEPVTTRIDEPLTRHYSAAYTPPTEAETEMPEDDTLEPLLEWIDLTALLAEALALALPDFPRAPGAELGTLTATPPGASPLDTARENPFASLAALKPKDTE